MALYVVDPGVLSTVQDEGRQGFLGSGFTSSGAMDKRAYRKGCTLLGNAPGAASLEFCLMGPTLRFTHDTYFALTGADFDARLDGVSVPKNQVVMVRRGQQLAVGRALRGMYGYLSVMGGFDESLVMGSRSTNLKCGVGGHGGRALVHGDVLWAASQMPGYRPGIWGSAESVGSAAAAVALCLEDSVGDSDAVGLSNAESGLACETDDSLFYQFDQPFVTLRVVLGPQDDLFTLEGIESFLNCEYEMTTQSDRMGARLEGPEITTKHGSDIVSDGIAFGAVQVPNHGKPIIMLADRQTTGGYAKIATVASIDIPKLVQCRPGSKVRFQAISVEEAQGLVRKEALLEKGSVR